MFYENTFNRINQHFSSLLPIKKINVVLNRIIYLLAFSLFCRIFFLLNNHDLLKGISLNSIVKASFLGLGTDIITLIVINCLPFLCTILFPYTRLSEKLDYLIFALCNLPFILISLIDVEYFRFTGQPLSISVLNIKTDIRQQTISLVTYYWYISLILLLISVVFIIFIPRQASFTRYFLHKITLILLLIFGSQSISDLSVSSGIKENNIYKYMLSNATLSLIRSSRTTEVKKISLLTDAEVAKYIRRDSSRHHFFHQKKQNVFIIICESLSSECLFKGKTPFLDSLSQQGLSMKSFYANGRESIDAIPAILASVPKLSDNHFIQYVSHKTYPKTIGSFLKASGYKTMFFHGARDGSMGFKTFTRKAGYDEYFGMDTYPDKSKHFDGAWGIFDEYFLSYACQTVSKVHAPFHSVLFTLSSHNPYKLPSHFPLKKGEKNEMHTSMRYADYSLKKFFREAEKTDWYQNTLFIITGDHTHLQTAEGKEAYQVPLIIFHPDKYESAQIKRKGNSLKIAQHIDILPSVLDFLNIEEKKALPFGESLFSVNEGMAFSYHSGVYHLFSPSEDVSFTLNRSEAKNQTFASIKLKAMLQYYHNTFMQSYHNH